jgi:hypothetical protein
MRVLIFLFVLSSLTSSAQIWNRGKEKANKVDTSVTDSVSTQTTLDTLLTDSLAIGVDSILPEGEVRYYQSEEIAKLQEQQRRINKENCPDLVQGYRVQIFSCSGNDCFNKTNEYYNQFLIAFPHISAHKLWDPPSHKIRVGDCRTRYEAEAIKAQIKGVFPGVFIVNDYIDSPFAVDCDDMEIEEIDGE